MGRVSDKCRSSGYRCRELSYVFMYVMLSKSKTSFGSYSWLLHTIITK